jgi:REP element-mobilizing transposase RayT
MPSRLVGWDYATNGAYFVTACAYQRTLGFGHVDADGVQLSPLGTVVARQLLAVTRDRPGVQLDAGMVMPDHLHFIVLLHGQPRTLTSVHLLVAALKATATNAARRDGILATRRPLWQRGFYDRVIRNDDELQQRRAYIADNPTRWRLSGR